jgi:DNA primase
METETVTAAVAQAAGDPRPGEGRRPGRRPDPATGGEPSGPERPAPDDPRWEPEREVLKLAIQHPALAGPLFDAVGDEVYTHPMYLAVRRAIASAGGAACGLSGPEWVEKIVAQIHEPALRPVIAELAVEPLRTDDEPDPRYVTAKLARLQEIAVERQVRDLKSKLQRVNPVEHADKYARLFGQLVSLEQHKRGLREQAIGGE